MLAQSPGRLRDRRRGRCRLLNRTHVTLTARANARSVPIQTHCVRPTYQASAARVERSESRVCCKPLLGGAVTTRQRNGRTAAEPALGSRRGPRKQDAADSREPTEQQDPRAKTRQQDQPDPAAAVKSSSPRSRDAADQDNDPAQNNLARQQAREASPAQHDRERDGAAQTHHQGKTGRADLSAGTTNASALAGPDRCLLNRQGDSATVEEDAAGC